MIQEKGLKTTHTIIISDLHLGSSVSQPTRVLKMLQGYSFRKLILLGDVFDSFDFRKLSKESSALIDFIGKISKERKVRWIEGNHDLGFLEMFGSLIGAKIYKRQYSWEYEGRKYLAIHGHQFDRFLVDNEIVSSLACYFYNFVQRLDFKDRRISHFMKRKSKGWLRLSEKVSDSAILYALKNHATYIFCGHTHKAMHKAAGNINYYNSGCWADEPCSYITVDGEKIKIMNY
jgi:UDP-2,3-diacylglucosamine pyrophosphatase LpxH